MISQQQMWWPGYERLDPLAEGLVALYPIWEGPGTSKIHNLVRGDGIPDGTLTNMNPATDWVIGPNGWALDFGGAAGEWIEIPYSHDPSTGLTTAVHAIVPAWGPDYLFGTHDGANRWYLGDTWGVGDSFGVGLGPTAGVWKTWFLIADGSNAFAFEDHTQIGTFGYTSPGPVSRDFRLAARDHNTTPGPLACTIDFAASWSRVLTRNERAEIIANPNALLQLRSRTPVGVTEAPPAGTILPQITSAYYRTNA